MTQPHAAPAHSRGAAEPGEATQSRARARVVVLGNPNVGKTTLFNRLTGQNARVGNYPGVTVERRSAVVRLDSGREVELVDVPGAYSLSSRSAEEQVAINAVMGWSGNATPDLAVLVLDAGQLARNLYLTLQLIELGVPLLLVLNMMDEVAGRPPQPEALTKLLSLPCVPTNARAGEGLEALREAIDAALDDPHSGSVSLDYDSELRQEFDRIADALPEEWKRESDSVERLRALGCWALMSIDEDDELVDIPDELRKRCLASELARSGELDQRVIATRYAFVDRHLDGLYEVPASVADPSGDVTESLDRVLLHPVWGFGIFLLIMLVVFQSLFSWADPAIGVIEDLLGWLQAQVIAVAPESFGRDLVTEGILGGVGNVVVFLPQILLLFLFIGLLEDSGYMARVAYLMDRIMRGVGLHGRAFVPMMSGFACAVPAILATRTMERQRDRILTMLVVPLMSCSARLPVYSLIIAALFPPSQVFGLFPVQGLLMVGMYVFSTTIALVAAAVLGRSVVKGRRVPLILELPRYRLPNGEAVLRMMWSRSKTFLTEAGTVILAFTIILWVLLSFPKEDQTMASGSGTDATEQRVSATAPANATSSISQSYAGRLGKTLEPAIEPLGFDWKIGIGLIGAFAAREVFVSTMALVYGLNEDVDDTSPSLRDRMRSETRATGHPAYTPLVGLSLMIFFALACQCMSTVAVVRRETQSWRWPLFLIGYMTALAWTASFLVYQGGKLLGFAS